MTTSSGRVASSIEAVRVIQDGAVVEGDDEDVTAVFDVMVRYADAVRATAGDRIPGLFDRHSVIHTMVAGAPMRALPGDVADVFRDVITTPAAELILELKSLRVEGDFAQVHTIARDIHGLNFDGRYTLIRASEDGRWRIVCEVTKSSPSR